MMVMMKQNLTRDEIRAFRANVREIILRAQESGADVPETIKRRDRREPMADEKELLEDKIVKQIKLHWKRQREKLEQMLQVYYNDRKNVIPPGIDDLLDEDDEEFEAGLIRLLLRGVGQGVQRFAATVPLEVDWTMVSTTAGRWAKKHAGDLIKGIKDTTATVVRQAVTDFIGTPGMTIGDLMNRLPFTESRARSVAVTETTRAYAQGQVLAGEEIRQQFPDVKITKIWFTNADEKVCELCNVLDGMEVDADENFYEPDEYSDGNPPRHVNCRCWMDTGTRING